MRVPATNPTCEISGAKAPGFRVCGDPQDTDEVAADIDLKFAPLRRQDNLVDQ
jgi:hypothetical protein